MVESVVGRVVVMVVVGVVGGMAAILLVKAEAAARAATNSTSSSSQQEGLEGNGKAALVISGGSDMKYTNRDGNMGVKPQQSSPSEHNLQGTKEGTNQLQREGSLLDALLSIIRRREFVAQQETSNSREKREVAQQEAGNNIEKREVHEHLQNARRKREELSKMETESQQPLHTTRHKIRHKNRKDHHRHYDRLDSREISESTKKLAIIQQQEEEIEKNQKSEINEEVVKENDEVGLSSSISKTEADEVSANSNSVVNSAAARNLTMLHPAKDRIILVSTANLKVSVLLAIPLALLLTLLLLVCVSLCCCCWRRRRKTSNDQDTTPGMDDEAQAEEGSKLECWIPFGCEACLPDISYQIHRDANPQYKPVGHHQSSTIAKTVPGFNTINSILPYSRLPLLHDLLSNLPPGASRIGFEDERILIDKDEGWSLEQPGVFEDEVQVSYGMNRRARSLESLVL